MLIKYRKFMKKLIITLICSTFLLSCENKKEYGVVHLDHEKTKLIEGLFKAVEEEDINYLKNLFSKDMVMVNSDN